MKNFEEYLQTMHAEQYHGVDDDMPEDFEQWLGELDTQEVMDYADNMLNELGDIVRKHTSSNPEYSGFTWNMLTNKLIN